MTYEETKQIVSEFNPELDNASMLTLTRPCDFGFEDSLRAEEGSDRAIVKISMMATDDVRLYVVPETTASDVREWIEEVIAELDEANAE